MIQEITVTYKGKRLPSDRKYKEKVNSKARKPKKPPSYVRKKVSSSIATKIKKAGVYDDVKYSKYINIPKMVKNIEMQFDSKMSWKNYGIYWNIDHIVPQCLFDFTDMEQIRMCWSTKNVRPLARVENTEKADKIDLNLIEECGLRHILQKVL